jgi:hypothetical protein
MCAPLVFKTPTCVITVFFVERTLKLRAVFDTQAVTQILATAEY